VATNMDATIWCGLCIARRCKIIYPWQTLFLRIRTLADSNRTSNGGAISISVILWACCAARPVGREQGDKNGLTPGPIPVRSCCFFQLQQAMLCFPLTQLLLILFMPRFLQYKTGASGLTPTGHLISKIEKKIKG
jgi:hypothetical protein